MTPVVVRPDASAEIEEAYRWYQVQRSGLGDEFLGVLSETVTRMRAHPEACPVVFQEIRRALVRSRFPYGLFYRIDAEAIVIMACMYAKRSPRRWTRRTRG